MRKKAPMIGIALVAAMLVGCSRSNQDEMAALRADLEATKQQEAELKAHIGNNGNHNQNAQPAQPATQKARLRIVRGLRPNWEYVVWEGRNVIGRADHMPVDIDLQPQEPDDRVWSSRQHAAITCKNGAMVIEDLNSANATYVNGKRVPLGEKRPLQIDDIIQIGEVQIKVLW